jgi:hypothetical protein
LNLIGGILEKYNENDERMNLNMESESGREKVDRMKESI